MLRLAHSDFGSPVSVCVVFWPVSPGSWLGGAWVPWRVVFWLGCLFVSYCDPGSVVVASFHCFTYKMGSSQIHFDGRFSLSHSH